VKPSRASRHRRSGVLVDVENFARLGGLVSRDQQRKESGSRRDEGNAAPHEGLEIDLNMMRKASKVLGINLQELIRKKTQGNLESRDSEILCSPGPKNQGLSRCKPKPYEGKSYSRSPVYKLGEAVPGFVGGKSLLLESATVSDVDSREVDKLACNKLPNNNEKASKRTNRRKGPNIVRYAAKLLGLKSARGLRSVTGLKDLEPDFRARSYSVPKIHEAKQGDTSTEMDRTPRMIRKAYTMDTPQKWPRMETKRTESNMSAKAAKIFGLDNSSKWDSHKQLRSRIDLSKPGDEIERKPSEKTIPKAVKVLVVGDSGCGKSTLISKYLDLSTGDEKSLGVQGNDAKKVVQHVEYTEYSEGSGVELGDCVADVDVILIVCDVGLRDRFEAIYEWRSRFLQFWDLPELPPMIIAGNKVETLTDVHDGFRVGAHLQKCAEDNECEEWYICSALENYNVEEIVKSIRKQADLYRKALVLHKAEMQRQRILDKLKTKSHFIKYGKTGRPKERLVWINDDETCLCWGKSERACKCLNLRDITEILIGQQSLRFQKFIKEEHKGAVCRRRSMTIISDSGKSKVEINLIAKGDAQFRQWIHGLPLAIHRSRDEEHMGT